MKKRTLLTFTLMLRLFPMEKEILTHSLKKVRMIAILSTDFINKGRVEIFLYLIVCLRA